MIYVFTAFFSNKHYIDAMHHCLIWKLFDPPRSELAQKVAANELAESFMAFNTNYSDAGLFGVYAVAKVDFENNLCWL